MDDKNSRPKNDTFDAWINRKVEEIDKSRRERDASPTFRREPLRDHSETPPAPLREDRPNPVHKQLEEDFVKADAEYRRRYERLHGLFERMFRDPENAVRRFNAIREGRGEERALKILERKPGGISPTKDALRAYFQHSTRERESADSARLEVREAYRQTQEAEDRRLDAGLALKRYCNQMERERQWER